MLYIRRPTLHDLNECALIDASYSTQKVWQMNQKMDAARIQVQFQLANMPRPMVVKVPPSEFNLLKCWQRGDCMFSAREGNELVGFIHMLHDVDKKTGQIIRHVVDTEYRRQGIGSGLLNHILQWSRERKLRIVRLDLSIKNDPAIEFYLANGFVFQGFTEHFFGDQQIYLQFVRAAR